MTRSGVVLITGMSGTGKSTVLAELAARGHRVIDTDQDGWAVEVLGPDGPEQVWDEIRIRDLLERDTDGPLFLAGCVSNQGRFYDRFDAVVLLTVPVDVMLQRIAERTTSEFGKDPRERERILRDLREVEPLLAATSTAVIDATRPLSEVADAVERFGVAT
jgi:dephospho-CoA kinase